VTFLAFRAVQTRVAHELQDLAMDTIARRTYGGPFYEGEIGP